MPRVGAGDERGELFKERFTLAPARFGKQRLHARAVVRVAAAQELFIVDHRGAVAEVLAALFGVEPADVQPRARRDLADAAAESGRTREELALYERPDGDASGEEEE